MYSNTVTAIGGTGLSRETAGLIELEHSLGAHNYKPLDVVLTRGERVWVWDVEGRRYLDCIASYGALPFGHNPAAIQRCTSGPRNPTCRWCHSSWPGAQWNRRRGPGKAGQNHMPCSIRVQRSSYARSTPPLSMNCIV